MLFSDFFVFEMEMKDGIEANHKQL